MMYQSFHPAVSYVLIPMDDLDQELFLSTSKDYSMGKLLRTGLDAVYGLFPVTPRKRIYDGNLVRNNLFEIQGHRNLFESISRKKVVFSQGHGNLGINNWAVAYINETINETTFQKFIIPEGEPIHERIYPSFIKKSQDPRYEIADIMYFYDNTKTRLTPKKYVDESEIVSNPDREISSNSVFLPIWNDSLLDTPIKTANKRDGRIDYSKGNIEFVKLERDVDGLITEIENIKIVKLNLDEKWQGEKKRYM